MVQWKSTFMIQEAHMPETVMTLKVRLKTPEKAADKLRRAMGCARFVHNYLLFETKTDYEDYLDELESRLIFGEAHSAGEAQALCVRPESVTKFSLTYRIKTLRKQYPFLASDAPAQVLQQECQRLAGAFKCFFEGKSGYPRFKRKVENESIRYPQFVRFNLKSRQLFLPKPGWLNVFNKKLPLTPGQAKGIHTATVVREGDRFYACLEYTVTVPETGSAEELSRECTGLDRGVVIPLQLSDGTQYGTELKERTEPLTEKIKLLQKRFKHKTKGSRSWRALRKQIAKLHLRIRNIRRDILHKATTEIAKSHGCICMEDLKLKNMTKSARGTVQEPGSDVRQKSGLNRELLLRALGETGVMPEYKLRLRGGLLIRVPPQYTSQTCPVCGHVSERNRTSQSEFVCEKCGHSANADLNAAENIKRAGRARIAGDAGSKGAVTRNLPESGLKTAQPEAHEL